MNFYDIENIFNRICIIAISVVISLIVIQTDLDKSLLPIGPSTYMNLTIGVGLTTLISVFIPRRFVSEINFWLLIILFTAMPFLFSRDTKENFLLVKETIMRIFLISMLAVYLFRKLSFAQLTEELNKVPKFLYAFVGIGILSLIWSKSPYMTVHYSLIFISYIILYVMVSDTLRKPWQFYTISDILITAAGIASVYGILQYYRIPGTNFNYDPLFGVGEVVGNTDRKRVFSFFGNPVFLGVYLDAALPIAFAIFLSAFANSSVWAHKYEKWLLRFQIGLFSLTGIYVFMFWKYTNVAIGDLLANNPNALSDPGVNISQYIVSAGEMAKQHVLFGLIGFWVVMYLLYNQINMLRHYEREINIIAVLSVLPAFFTSICLFMLKPFLKVLTGSAVSFNFMQVNFKYFVVVAFLGISAAAVYYAMKHLDRHEKQIYRLIVGLFSFLLIFYCIYVTFTRTAWIATAAALSFFAILLFFYAHDIVYAYRKWILSFVIIFSFSTIVLTAHLFQQNALNTGTESIAGRLTSAFTVLQRIMLYDITINVIKQSPVMGHGLGSFGYMYPIHQEKFYKGEFRSLIDSINSFCKFKPVNSSLNFMAWSFGKYSTSSFSRIFVGVYFMIVLIGGTLLLIYYKDIDLKRNLSVYLAFVILPLLYVFKKFAAFPDYYLKLHENILPVNPDDYQWLSAGFAHVHNEYLQVWSDMGIFGICIFLYTFAYFFIKGCGLISTLKKSPDRILIIGYMCAVIAMLVESIANFPFQRIMPILIASLSFAIIFNGRRIFLKDIQNDGIKVESSESDDANSIDVKKEYVYTADYTGGILNETLAPELAQNRDFKEHLKNNIMFYASVSILILGLNYFPARYVLGNIDLKSGHTFIMQAPAYRENKPELFKAIMDEGIRYLQRSCERVPYNSEAWFWYGDTLKILGRYKDAIDKLNVAISLNNTKHAFYSLGICYYELYKMNHEPKDMAKAIESWKRAVGVNPNFPQPLYHLGFYEYQTNKDYKQALYYLKNAFKWDQDALGDAYKIAGLSAYALGQMTEAVEFLGKAKAKGAVGISKAYGVLLSKSGKTADSVSAFEQAVAEDANDSEAFAMLLQLYKKNGSYDKAVELLKQNSAKLKESPEYFIELGNVYFLAGSFDKSLLEFGKGLDKYKDNVAILEGIARVYFEGKKDYKMAASFFEKILQKSPDSILNQYNLGVCCFYSGDLNRAKELWEKVKARDPKFKDIDVHLQSLSAKQSQITPKLETNENALKSTAEVAASNEVNVSKPLNTAEAVIQTADNNSDSKEALIAPQSVSQKGTDTSENKVTSSVGVLDKNTGEIGVK